MRTGTAAIAKDIIVSALTASQDLDRLELESSRSDAKPRRAVREGSLPQP